MFHTKQLNQSQVKTLRKLNQAKLPASIDISLLVSHVPERVGQKKVCVVYLKYPGLWLVVAGSQTFQIFALLGFVGAEMEKEADASDMFVQINFHPLNFFLLYKGKKNCDVLFDFVYLMLLFYVSVNMWTYLKY